MTQKTIATHKKKSLKDQGGLGLIGSRGQGGETNHTSQMAKKFPRTIKVVLFAVLNFSDVSLPLFHH
jgi:hypothetical protein